MDLREYDVPYHVRFSIDCDVRAGQWFEVHAEGGVGRLAKLESLRRMAEPVVCAFDIETTKLPLQFPNAEYDQVFMISYMVDRQGFLLVNREVVSADVADFEYSPKAEFPGPFTVVNVADERELLERWYAHMRRVRPGIFVTYNGDFFDWPFLQARSERHGIDMHQSLGFK